MAFLGEQKDFLGNLLGGSRQMSQTGLATAGTNGVVPRIVIGDQISPEVRSEDGHRHIGCTRRVNEEEG